MCFDALIGGFMTIASNCARASGTRKTVIIAALLSSSALCLAPLAARAQDSMEIEDPSVSIIAFNGVAGTVFDSVTLTDFSSPLIADSGSIIFGSNQRYFVSTSSGLDIVSDLDANPILFPSIGRPGLPRTMTLDQQTGDVFLGTGVAGQFIEGNVDATLFEPSINIGNQFKVNEVRAQDGQLLVVDENDIFFRDSNLGDEFGILLVATPNQNARSGSPNDPKFGGINTVVASFSFNGSDVTAEQAYSVRPLEGSSGISSFPLLETSDDQVFAGVTIPAGQFNTSSSLDQISSNGTVVAFTIPVAETASGNFGVALATQTITRDSEGNVTGVTDGTPIIFGVFTDIIDGIALSITPTSIGDRVFRSRGTQFEAEINPTVAANGDVIFFGRASIPGGDDITSGYWRLRASDGVIEPFLIDGMQIDGLTSFGTEDFGIIDFDSDLTFGLRLAIEPRLTINRDGNVAAVVRVLLPDEVEPVTAIVGQNVNGDLFLVAHEGQEVDLGDGAGVRTVAIADSPGTEENVVFVSGGANGNEVINSNDLDGVSDGFNINSQLAFVLSFTDGSQALLRADLGTAGEPDITVFRWTGGCGSAEWGTRCTIDSEGASNWSNFDPPGQVASEAPGLDTDPADVFIMNADVTITQNDVSVTTLTATDSKLTVERSLTLAQGSSLDQLVVNGGTVTSGSGPVTANNVTLMGGTLDGAGGFNIVDQPTNSGDLLLVEPGTGGAASVIDTFVTATDGTVRLRDDAQLSINDLSSLTVQGSTGILRLGNGSVISGDGDLIITDGAELAAAFDSAGTSTISAPLRLGTSTISAGSSSTIDITRGITFTEVFSSDLIVTGSGNINISGPVTVADGARPSIRLIGVQEGAGTAPQISFKDTSIALGEDGSLRVGYPDFRSGPQPNSVSEAFANPVVGAFVDTDITVGGFFAIQATSLFRDVTVDALFSGNSSAVISLEGDNTFTLRTQSDNANVTSEFVSSVLAQRSGTTTFAGDTPLSLRDLIDTTTRVFVADGTMNFQTPRLNIQGTERPGVIFAPSGTGRIVIGALPEGARLDLRANNVQFGQGGGGLSGGGVAIMGADISVLQASDDPIIFRNMLNTIGPVTENRSLALRDVAVNSSLTIENDGPLLLSGMGGLESVDLNNRAGVLLTGAWTNVGQITNIDGATFTFEGPNGALEGGDFFNGGLLAVAENGAAMIGSNLRVREDTNPTGVITGRFTVGTNAQLTAPETELLDTIRDPGNDVEARGVALDGLWTLETGSTVTLSSNTVIENVAAGASLTVRGTAAINCLSAANNTLRRLDGEVVFAGVNAGNTAPNTSIGSDFTIGSPTASDASFTAGGLSVTGDLTLAAGSLNLRLDGDKAITNLDVDGELVVFGSATARTAEVSNLRVIEGGSLQLAGDLTSVTGVTIDGRVDSDGAGAKLGTLRAETVSIGTQGILSVTELRVTQSITNAGRLAFGDVIGGQNGQDLSYTALAGSVTDVSTLEDDNRFSIGGNIVLNGELLSPTTSAQKTVSAGGTLTLGSNFQTNANVRGFFSIGDLTIEQGAQFGAPLQVGSLDVQIAADVRFTSLRGGENANQVGFDFRLLSGGRLTGISTGSTQSTLFGFNLGNRPTPAIVDFVEATIEAGATLAGDVGFSGSVTNEGSIFPGFSPGLLVVNGDYTQTQSGVLGLEIGGTDEGTFDQVLINGTATLDPASTINITLIDPNPDDGVDEVFRPRTGDTFDILLADSVAVTGGGDIADIITITNADQSGSFLPSFMTVDGQFMLQLEALFGSRLAETAGLNTLQGGIAGALDAISEVGDNDTLTDFAVALDGLSDDQTGAALSQAGFSFASGLYDMGFAAINASTGHIHRHIDARIWTPKDPNTQTVQAAPMSARRPSPNNAGFAGGMVFEEASQAAQMVASIAANQSFAMRGADQSRFGLIASGGYSFGSVDASLNQTGIDYSGGGGALGAEAALNETVVVGVSASLTSLDGDTDNGLGDLEATHYGIAVHAVAQAGPLVVDGQVGFGWLDVESDRRIAAGDVSAMAEGESDGSTFNARARISLPITGGDDGSTFVFGPSIELNTANVDLNGFAETGAGDAGLTLSGNSQWRSNVAFGVNAAASFELRKVVLTPRASAAYEVALNRSSDPIATAFNGAPQNGFLTPTDRASKDRFKVLTATDLRLSRRISASIAYQGSYSSDIKDHTVMAQARLSF